MKLSALDIRKQEFARVFRGYDPEEVDAFRHMLSQQWHLLTEDIRRLEQRIQDQQDKLDHYRKVEEALEEALQTAREGARQRIEHAERKATGAVKDAEEKAGSILHSAEAKAQRIVEEAEDIRRRARRGIAEATMRRNEIVTRLRSFLSSEMDLLSGFESLEAQRDKLDPIDEAPPAYDTSFDIPDVDVTDEESVEEDYAEVPSFEDMGETPADEDVEVDDFDEAHGIEAIDDEAEAGDEDEPVDDDLAAEPDWDAIVAEESAERPFDAQPDDILEEEDEPAGPTGSAEAGEQEDMALDRDEEADVQPDDRPSEPPRDEFGAEDEIRKIRRILEDLDG